jgi:hypothetical protein
MASAIRRLRLTRSIEDLLSCVGNIEINRTKARSFISDVRIRLGLSSRIVCKK